MSTPESIVEAQTEALLRRVAREQETRCRRARDAAQEQARSIVKRAWEEARTRLRQAVQDERRALEQSLADRRAALETVARQQELSVLRELMDEAWRGLPGALEAAWNDVDARREWCASACGLALRVLNHAQGLEVEFDADASRDCADRIRAALGDSAPGAVALKPVSGLGPGLRIRAGRASVDATVPGLLASRERIEAELLAEIEALAPGDQGR
jgi:hypothetical protein